MSSHADSLSTRIAERGNALVLWHRGVRRYGWRYVVRQAWQP